jgi:hypothetical protein
MTFAQILDGRVHWVFEANTQPVFAPYIVIKDITNVSPQPQEGWDYNSDTGTYCEHVETTTSDTITSDDKLNYLYYKATGAVS